MGQWFALSTFYIIVPALSLLATAFLKERTRFAGGPYPTVVKILRWVLSITILVGVLNLVLLALTVWGDPTSPMLSNLASSLQLIHLVLTVPAWFGAYVGWYVTPLWLYAVARRSPGRRR